MNRVKKLIHTDYAYRSGLSGRNVAVAVMDTGERVVGMQGGHAPPGYGGARSTGIGQSGSGIR